MPGATRVLRDICAILGQSLGCARKDAAIQKVLHRLVEATESYAAVLWPANIRYCEHSAWMPAKGDWRQLDGAAASQEWIDDPELFAAPVGHKSVIAIFPRPGLILECEPAPLFEGLLDVLGPLAAPSPAEPEAASTETAKDEQLRLLSLVAKHTSNGMVLTDPRGRIEWVNDGFERIYGYTLAEVQGRRSAEFLYGRETDWSLDDVINRAMGQGERFAVELRLYRKSGECCLVRSAGHPLFDDAGVLTHYFRVCTDISEQRRVEEELRASEAHFRELADSAPVLVWMSGPDQLITYVNQRWLQFTGLTLSQSLGEGWRRIVHPDDLDRVTEVYSANFDSRLGFTMEFRLRRSDDEYRWVVSHGEPRFGSDGEFQGYVGGCYDINDRYETEQQLQQSASRQQALISAIPDLMFLLDRDGRFVDYHAQRPEDLFLPPDDFLGRRFADVFPPHLAAQLAAAVESLSSPGSIELIEVEGPTIGGNIRHFETRLTRTVLGEYLILSRDVTGRKQAEEASKRYIEAMEEARRAQEAQNRALEEQKLRAEAASLAKSEFLAVMSHEIRTPLNGVLGMTELLLDAPLPAEERDAIDTIWRSASSLVTIVNDILDFSRVEAGKIQLESTPFNLTGAMQDLMELMRPRAREKHIEVRLVTLPGAPEMVIGDPVRVRQIALNFLSNAIKFTETGSVTLELAPEPVVGVRISVQDTGAGIPPDQLTRLFERFTQGDSSTTRRHGGTGLGLAISKQLAELMKGSIEVESKVGLGSTFICHLPLPEASSESVDGFKKKTASPLESNAFVPGCRRVRALVVEDNPVNQKVAIRLLEKLGCDSDLAENGLIGVEMHAKNTYDVIFMDCRMPVMDGFEATRRIREAESGFRVPIVAITASAIEAERGRCLAAGMNAYLAKPVSLQRLREVLEQIVEMPHVVNRA